ncbi:PorP/SprF family type IX secretion system membrane protein [Aquimarina intermedia]|uniref:Type IX secretion system PorP/SprF family membrane protein n=1 Tax=Aquimarina intermedia TaxID=350814 RepID=A0A5S5CCE0_9FLAO|nr:type IX secretion system membrane protein PorP/SprF [Aquimarina intermedia]TYP77041.1 type IX secretion system PorP/SprF family membrane protein [Aquimarina intermedia]
MHSIKCYQLILLLCVALYGMVSHAQQLPQYTQYMYNTMSINPAYAGSNDRIEASLLHRSQWVGIDGAPQTQVLTLNGKFFDKIGLGFNIFNDKIGPSSQIDINFAFSYHLKLNATVKLGLGVNAGMDVLSIDWSKGEIYENEDSIFNENISKLRPIIGAGSYIFGEQWYAGISASNFIKSQRYDDNEEILVERSVHYYLLGGYVFQITPQLKMKPATMVKLTEGAPITFDISTNFLIQEKLTLGASYRFDDAVSGLAGFQVSNTFYVGYGYDYSISNLSKYNSGSHEIILRYTLHDRKRKARSPRFF